MPILCLLGSSSCSGEHIAGKRRKGCVPKKKTLACYICSFCLRFTSHEVVGTFPYTDDMCKPETTPTRTRSSTRVTWLFIITVGVGVPAGSRGVQDAEDVVAHDAHEVLKAVGGQIRHQAPQHGLRPRRTQQRALSLHATDLC